MWELFAGYLTIASLMYLASNSAGNLFSVVAIILASTLVIFLIVFRKRPISANFKVRLTSGIDLRWNLKRGEKVIS